MKRHITKSVFFTFLSIAISLVFLTPLVSAEGETYKYSGSGSTIGSGTITKIPDSEIYASGGSYSSTILFKKTAVPRAFDQTITDLNTLLPIPKPAELGSYTYIGTVEVQTCTLGLEIRIPTIGSTTGTLSTPSDLNNLKTITSGNETTGSLNGGSCTAASAKAMAIFNKSIQIGTNANSEDINNLEETKTEREIYVRALTDKAMAALPQGIKFTLANSTDHSTVVKRANNESSSEGIVYGVFTDVSAGPYYICYSPKEVFTSTSIEQCQTVVKKMGDRLTVTFGSMDTNYNSEGKIVEVEVKFALADRNATYGPITVYIKKSDFTNLFNKDTNKAGASITSPENAIVSASFDGIDPGRYKACLEKDATSTSLCSDFTKNINEKAKVTIEVPLSETGNFVNQVADGRKCAIDGIGWLLCPVMTFMGGVVDASYGVVSDLLAVHPLSTSTDQNSSDNGIYKAWAIMRTIANIAFVIVFLIIIFSQITSIGVTNYGVKKLLPRIVIAAILVNLSYFICTIAVDLSNILGNSLKQVFDGIGGQITVAPRFIGEGGSGWAGLVTLILAGGTISVFAGASILLPALIAAITAIVVIFLVLTIRQALIIILIVISPIAFIAFLLPNTEKLFKKWQDLLTTLLLMFPIIAAIFGASALASKVILSDPNATWPVQIMGALVAIVPLALTPIIMKTAGKTLGGIGAKIQGLSKKPVGTLNKGAEGIRKRQLTRMDNRSLRRNFSPRRAILQRRARIEAIDKNQQSEFARSQTEYVANQAQNNNQFMARLAQGSGEGAEMRALAAAINVKLELEAKEVKAASAVIDHLNLSATEKQALAEGRSVIKGERTLLGTDSAVRSAGIMSSVALGNVKNIESVIRSSGDMNDFQRRTLVSSMISAGIPDKATHLGGATLGEIGQGTLGFNVTYDADGNETSRIARADGIKESIEKGINNATIRAIAGGKYSAEKIIKNEPESLARIENIIIDPNARAAIGATNYNSVINQFTIASTDARMKAGSSSAAKPYINRIAEMPEMQIPEPGLIGVDDRGGL